MGVNDGVGVFFFLSSAVTRVFRMRAPSGGWAPDTSGPPSRRSAVATTVFFFFSIIFVLLFRTFRKYARVHPPGTEHTRIRAIVTIEYHIIVYPCTQGIVHGTDVWKDAAGA